MNILVVEDETSIRNVLKSYFSLEGWDVMTSADGQDALRKFRKVKVDMLVLDLMLPNLSGEDVCKKIRKHSNVPILVISAKSREKDMINLLNMGADDYITKPFRIKEVVARVNALRRRIEMFEEKEKHQSVVSFNDGKLKVNFETKEVFVNHELVNLTFTEFEILNGLIKTPRKVLSRQDLSYKVQGYRYVGDGRTIDAHIKNLRKKIEDDPQDPQYIITRIGSGYQFNFSPDDD